MPEDQPVTQPQAAATVSEDEVAQKLKLIALSPIYPFYKREKGRGKLVTIAGLTGTGKSLMANFWSGDMDTTFIVDTEPVHTTIETLELYGQEKVWKAFSWDEIMRFTDEFLRIAKQIGKQCTLVLDSGSVMVQWIKDKMMQEQKKKAITPWEHEDVWEEIRKFFKKVIFDNGHNLVLTLLLGANYTPEKTGPDGKKTYGRRDGTFSPYEWKDLAFHCHYAFQLERGIHLKASDRTIFPDKIFCRVRKTRWVNEGFKKFLVPFGYEGIKEGKLMYLYTEEAANEQLMDRFSGDIFTIMRELLPTCAPAVQRDMEEFLKKADKADSQIESPQED